MSKHKKMYLVTAYKAINPYRNPHNYVVGLYTDSARAEKEGKDHCNFRDGKYHCCIEDINVDLSHEDSEFNRIVSVHKGRK